MTTSSTTRALAHLYRRAGFGATPAEIEAAEKIGYEASVDNLLAGLAEPDHAGSAVELPQLTPLAQANVPGFSYDDYQEFVALSTWWIDRMIVTDTPLREKLVLLLHEQFPTSYQKVGYADLMYRQNQIFRTLGPGSFEELTLAVAQDPAMLIWLDTGTDYKAHPNENFARELMERFTMGVGNYTEEDVRQSARAFTGWTLDYTTGNFFFNVYDHDGGEKRFLGKTGRWQGQDIVNIVTHTTASSKWVVARLWSWLAYPVTTEDRVVADLAPGYKKDLNVTNLLSAILHHPDFVSTRAMNGLVKQPVEYLVGTLRLLGLRTAAFSEGSLVYLLAALGQQLFVPMNVGGWGQNQYWLSTSSSNNQLSLAWSVAQYADLTEVLDLNGNPGAQVDTVKKMLAIDAWSDRTYRALWKTADKGSAQELLVMALVSPEYLLN
ncbi:MAG: DUF1800 domain-containing protein [Acidimicrobiales bacterium]|jgi:uncharacterized protein (DUF1800 family)